MKKRSYISSDPSIMRGALVISGTRVPLVRILYLLKEGYTLNQIHGQYNWLPKTKLKGAIAELAAKLDAANGETIIQA